MDSSGSQRPDRDAGELSGRGQRNAGELTAWLREAHDAIRGDGETDVPCDGCTACCRSSQFVHIAPEESDTLAHVPGELLFDAPGAPAGHKLMGYDERGHCPMLVDDRCSIYEHRPRTCRTFDCRVYTATGIEPDAAQPAVAAVVQEWRFGVDSEEADRTATALRTAGSFVEQHRTSERFARSARTQLGVAVTAVQLAVEELCGPADEPGGG